MESESWKKTMRADLARIVKQVLLGVEAACACAEHAIPAAWRGYLQVVQVTGRAA